MAKRKTAKKRAVKKSKNSLFLPYPLVVFLLLAAGVFLTAWTFKVSADDVLVTARIEGPPITTAAQITSPADGTHFSAVPIDVTGNCPANAAYIEIFRNNFMGGSAICSASNTFQVQTDLFAGQNDLTIHSFNITDDEGPVSDIVKVFYDVPLPPATGQPTAGQPSSGSGSTVPEPAKNPLSLKTAFVYKGYYIGQEVQWPIEISGGSRPYALNVDWGDGKNSIISRKTDGQFTVDHTYSKAGGYKGSYQIKIQASDSDGAYAYLEFFVIINSPTNAPGVGNIYTKPPPSIGGLRHLLWVAWPVYAVVSFMAVSFKLGEREELIILKKRRLLKRV